MSWHAIYGHCDKRTDVSDVRKVGKVLLRSTLGVWRVVSSKPQSQQES